MIDIVGAGKRLFADLYHSLPGGGEATPSSPNDDVTPDDAIFSQEPVNDTNFSSGPGTYATLPPSLILTARESKSDVSSTDPSLVIEKDAAKIVVEKVLKKQWSLHLINIAGDGTQTSRVLEDATTKESMAELLEIKDKIEAYVQSKHPAEEVELLGFNVETCTARWQSGDGKLHMESFYTKENGRPTCFQEFREVLAKNKEVGWNLEQMPTYSEYTKGNSQNGAASLVRGNDSRRNEFRNTKSAITAGYEKMLKKPGGAQKVMNIQADLYRAQRLKDHLTKVYEDLSKESLIKADEALKDPTIPEQNRLTVSNQHKNDANNLKEKADYFRGTSIDGDKVEKVFDWDLVYRAIRNPIQTGGASLNNLTGAEQKRIVEQFVTFKNEITSEIEELRTNRPKYDVFGRVMAGVDAITPPFLPVAPIINGIVDRFSDRTDHALTPEDHKLAADIASLSVIHKDPRTARFLTVQCNHALGVHETEIRNDPAERMVGELLAVLGRSAPEDISNHVQSEVLGIEEVNRALCSGFSTAPGSIGANIQAKFIDFANEMKRIEVDLSPPGQTLTTVAEIETAFKIRIDNLPKITPASQISD